MTYPNRFFKATDEMNTYEKHIPAPLIRKTFLAKEYKKAYITVTGLGFYRLFINGKDITKGLLAPYISNPDDMVYYDRYEVTEDLLPGQNAVGLILGNGMQNAPGGRVWDFDIADFRNVPSFAMSITYVNENGTQTQLQADESFRCHPSPILFDDLRSGCFYDANLEIKGWNMPDFDDSAWDCVKKAEQPRGEKRLCTADSIVITGELKPVDIYKGMLDERFDNRRNMRLNTQYSFAVRGKQGVVFDFGVNTAGLLRLKINGKKGQRIFIQLCEHKTTDGKISYLNTGSFYPDNYGQSVLYICKGEPDEEFVPDFTYFGFRYAVVYGLEEEQITHDTLTMLVANSHLKERGGFNCSDAVMNQLRDMGRRSDLANFYYFPTDCPHREKNGWTGDAAVSAERMLLTLTPEQSYTEWLRNICKAQGDNGCLPGIIPTGGWGLLWGNGPAWDNVLTELCWQIYRLRGDLTPAKECSEAMLRYLSYLSQKRRPDGLIAIGLGDWLQPLKHAGSPNAPLYVTDSVISMYICKKSADLFGALGLACQKEFAEKLYRSFREAIRANLIDFNTMTVISSCQTAQAMCIYYGVFEPGELAKANEVLVRLVHQKDDHLDCGLLGIRVLFHVLSDCGEGELAYKMITREDFPSYGLFIKQGLTSLPEDFLPEEEWDTPNSQNHHFMGDINSWFLQKVVGIQPNPRFTSPNDIMIKPAFISGLTFAEGFYEAPCGKIKVKWQRENGIITLSVDCPKGAVGYITTPAGYCFVNTQDTRERLHGSSVTELKSGVYTVSEISEIK